MDLVRNIISNLYIYKNQNNDTLNMKNFGDNLITYQNMELIRNEENNENLNNKKGPKTNIENNENKIIYENINKREEPNKILRKNNSLNRIDNYNHKYIALKSNNFLKNEVNYVAKNKELLKEQENQMKEIKQKKENEALNLLLSYKNRNTDGVKTRIYDYEIKQKEKNKSLIKNNKYKIRNLSSQKQLRNIIQINNNENQNQKSDTLNNEEKIVKNTFAKSIKLPKIKPSTSSTPIVDDIPVLHKDYGKMPEYLEKRKKELQEQKELEIKKEKEKNLPVGWRILSEEERQQRLEKLKNEKKDLEEKLFKLPIARLSRQQEDFKRNIEKSLNEIDEKINKLTGYKEIMVKKDEEESNSILFLYF